MEPDEPYIHPPRPKDFDSGSTSHDVDTEPLKFRERLEHLPPSDHRGRAKELVAAITADPYRDLELTAQVAVAEAALAVADELAKLRQLFAKKLPD